VENLDPSKAEQEVALAVPGEKPEQPADPAREAAAADKSQAADGTGSKTDVASAPKTAEGQTAEQAAESLKAEIEKEIGGVSGKLAEGLIVSPAEGGLLVTISDQSEAPMFTVGSAVPRKELVVAMERIGKLLQGREGPIVIRGHTDGRQFKGTENDNWRLSMARAHSAYYMLVRGGLSEGRVKQVSGFADRRLQVPDDPLADANRRIEILIQADQG
jgi:chemotaxis protein MotB